MFHGFGVGDAHAFNERELLLEQIELTADVFSAAMDQHGDRVVDDRPDAFGKFGKQTGRIDGGAADFDADDRFRFHGVLLLLKYGNGHAGGRGPFTDR